MVSLIRLALAASLSLGASAPAAPAAPEAAPAAPGARIHVVAPGENLANLAQRHGLHWRTLARVNGIRNPNVVRVGQRLVIPAAPRVARPAAPSASPSSRPAAGEKAQAAPLKAVKASGPAAPKPASARPAPGAGASAAAPRSPSGAGESAARTADASASTGPARAAASTPAAPMVASAAPRPAAAQMAGSTAASAPASPAAPTPAAASTAAPAPPAVAVQGAPLPSAAAPAAAPSAEVDAEGPSAAPTTGSPGAPPSPQTAEAAVSEGAPAVPTGPDGQPLVTNVFSETDLRQALSDVSAQTGVAIIPDATVQGSVTADLKDVPLEAALERLLMAGGFAFTKMEGYYLVGAPDPSNPNFHLLTRTEVVELKHTTPQVILGLLGGLYGRYLTAESAVPLQQPTPSSSLSSSLTLNGSGVGGDRDRGGYRLGPVSGGSPGAAPQLYRVLITAPERLLPRIKADIALLDQPPTQVMLEAVVLEISEEALKTVGIDWASRYVRSDLTTGGANLVYSTVANKEMAALTALVQQGKARLRANPRVATAEGQVAELEVGKESYFAVVTGPVSYPYTTLQEIRSGILLRITPRVIKETNEIAARLEPEVRDVTGRGANNLPEITFRRASTNLRVKNGQSIVIGGLITEVDSRTVNKVPLLGDLPLLGGLFRRTGTRHSRTEVVIIVTPHVLDASGRYPSQTEAAEELKR